MLPSSEWTPVPERTRSLIRLANAPQRCVSQIVPSSPPNNTVLLGAEALDFPGVSLAAVADPVVETVLPVLPELVDFGHEAIAAPVLRAWDVGGIRLLELG